MTTGDGDARDDPLTSVPTDHELADIALNRLRHRAAIDDRAAPRFEFDEFAVQRVMGRARREALNGCVDATGALNGKWSGYRLAAYVAYYLVAHHTHYSTGSLPGLRRDAQHALGDAVLERSDYLQVCAIDLADAAIVLVEKVELAVAPEDPASHDVAAIADSLNLVLTVGTDGHANDMVPTLQDQFEIVAAKVRGDGKSARAWRRYRRSRVALIATAAVVVVALATWFVVDRVGASSEPPAPSAPGRGTSAAPVVPDVLERVDATTPDGLRSTATPWSETPEPIVLNPDDPDRTNITVAVTLQVDPPQNRDVTVWLSFARPGGVSYVPGETKMSNKNGPNQVQPIPEPPPSPNPPQAKDFRIPLTLASDGTPTVYETELIINELQGPQGSNVPPPPSPLKPGDASVLRCGVNALPLNVLLSDFDSDLWINIPVPVYVLKACPLGS